MIHQTNKKILERGHILNYRYHLLFISSNIFLFQQLNKKKYSKLDLLIKKRKLYKKLKLNIIYLIEMLERFNAFLLGNLK